MMLKHNYYLFFTKYSLMENYGFFSGFTSLMFKKIIPEIPENNNFEYFIDRQIEQNNVNNITKVVNEFLLNPTTKEAILNDLDSAIISLSSKIISFGFDSKFQTIFKKLNIDSQCYKELLHQTSYLSKEGKTDSKKFNNCLNEIASIIKEVRRNKKVIGTSTHLTVTLTNLKLYIQRVKILIDLKGNITSIKKWEFIINDYCYYKKSKNSLQKYFVAHMDLLALEIVEHTANKGEKYVADNFKEYISFFKKGLLGGFIISIFALFKIIIDASIVSTIPLAILYSINYALCFVIVFLLGGIIATKQPAMTASTIAKSIDKDGNLQFDSLHSIVLLLRKISRSQFISLVGNFIMAFLASCFLAFLLTIFQEYNPIDSKKSINLVQDVFPFSGGAVYYAAIAGVFLSLSGFVSGYFDNKVKAINLAYRIEHNKFLSRFLSHKTLNKISLVTIKNLGIYSGNISLGIFLGSAFLLSYITPFNIDIRHIAFSSSNVGYGIINETFSFSTITFALISVLTIGLVNFLVSFSMTFLLVLKTRGLKIKSLGRLIRLSIKDLLKNPLDYLIYRKK